MVGSKMRLAILVKTALKETRMLVLGAQVLLGFELAAYFETGSSVCRSTHAYSMGLRCCC